MSLNYLSIYKNSFFLFLLCSIAGKSFAQDQTLDRYAMCLATLHTLKTIDNSHRSEIDIDIKKVQSAAFGYIKKKSPTVKLLDSNGDFFSQQFERYMDYYMEAAQVGGYSLVQKALQPNLRSCD